MKKNIMKNLITFIGMVNGIFTVSPLGYWEQGRLGFTEAMALTLIMGICTYGWYKLYGIVNEKMKNPSEATEGERKLTSYISQVYYNTNKKRCKEKIRRAS